MFGYIIYNMEHTLYNQINPYVRYVNYLENRNNSNHVIPWRSLLDYEILFVTRGQITVQTKTDKFTVKENQFHIMSPNVEHTRYFENNLSCDYFNMHLDLFYDHLISDFSVIDTYIHFKIPPDYNKRHNKVSPRKSNRAFSRTFVYLQKYFYPLQTNTLKINQLENYSSNHSFLR